MVRGLVRAGLGVVAALVMAAVAMAAINEVGQSAVERIGAL